MAGFSLDEEELQEKLKEMQVRFEEIDMDKVIKEGEKATAADLTQVVRDAVAAHPQIKSPANFISEYYKDSPKTSKGSPLTKKVAWQVDETPRGHVVRPASPAVRKKAVLMELGRRSIKKPKDGNPMKFWVDGQPISTYEVGPIPAKHFWRAAVRKIRSEGKISENLEDELRKEFRRNGFNPR